MLESIHIFGFDDGLTLGTFPDKTPFWRWVELPCLDIQPGKNTESRSWLVNVDYFPKPVIGHWYM